MEQLYTRWGRDLNTTLPLPEYPREQMRRNSYMNLNGLWDYSITSASQKSCPETWDGTILVPFSPETALSQAGRQLQPEESLWYHRTLPDLSHRRAVDRVLLHFGAVDQSCTVFVNGKIAAGHSGGYLPFSADITALLGNNTHPDELTVQVRDLSDTSYYARGKQRLHRGGMYYMATSGIWQTVWLEIVPEVSVRELYIEPLMDENAVSVRVIPSKMTDLPVTIHIFEPEIRDNSGVYRERSNSPDSIQTSPEFLVSLHGTVNQDLIISLPLIRLWDTGHPWLYPMQIRLGEDEIFSYFALRKISIETDKKGLPRICLNHKPVFLRGILDQGYWPESYYTPPSEEAMIFDLTEMKRFGFNMVRKHAKIEPDRWYYHCDRLGLLVWQDIVNGGERYDDFYVTIRPNLQNWKNRIYKTYDVNKTGRSDPRSRKEFQRELTKTVKTLQNHPSIIAWTLFNEGWGQFQTRKCVERLREIDSTRPIDAASGWFDQNEGDFKSVHNYFFPFRMYPESSRPFILSEFGGLPMLLKDHSTCEKLYGYGRKYRGTASLTKAYRRLNEKLERKIPDGLCATVYTQWTDIEDEVNGIYTWDREIKKIGSD